MFKSKINEETDNEFYENLKHLNEERKNARRYSNATINETISIKEENIFNKDILNLINSPTVYINIMCRKQGKSQIYPQHTLMIISLSKTKEYLYI